LVFIVLSCRSIESILITPVPDALNSRSLFVCSVPILLSVNLMLPSTNRFSMVTMPVPAGTKLMSSLLRVAMMSLPVSSMLSAANLVDVKAMLPVMAFGVDTGSVTSQGDASHNGPAARALGRTWSENAVSSLAIALMQDNDALVREQAARALSHTAGEEAIGALAYALTHGPIPDNLVVRHACDNRACVNPAHLSTGTHYDNAQDRVERNRSPIGAAHPRAKLTEEEVFWIWDLRHLGKAKLSRLFDVSKGCIAGIIKRRNWRVLLFNR